jgi:hypothetical protein
MRIWFDRLRLLRSSPASPTRRWLVRRGNQWLWCLLRSSTYREAPPFRHKAILIILQSITPGMTRIMHRAGIGATRGAGDGLSEFPSDLADAGTAGSAAAFPVQTSDASALVTLASSIRGSDAPALSMRVLVAVSVAVWAGASTVAAGTASPAHVRHPSCRSPPADLWSRDRIFCGSPLRPQSLDFRVHPGKWDQGFESSLLPRRVRCEPDFSGCIPWITVSPSLKPTTNPSHSSGPNPP